MKLIYKLLLITVLMPLMAKAATIDPTKSYYLIQTQNTSAKVLGANENDAPAAMYAENDITQQFIFEAVVGQSGVYRLKNSLGYLSWTGTGTDLTYLIVGSGKSFWSIEDVGTTGFVALKNVDSNTYLTSSDSTEGTSFKVGASLPNGASLSAFKLVTTTDLLANNVIDSGFEYGLANSAPIGKWVNDVDAVMGGSASSRVYTDPQVVTTGSHAFQLRFLDDGKSYNKISYLLTNLKKDASYDFSFDFIQLKWDNFIGTFSVYASTSPNIEFGNSTNVNGTKFSSTRATNLQVKSGKIAFIAPDTSCYIVFSKDGEYTENYIDNIALEETQNQNLEFITPSNSNVTSETTLPGTFKVTGVNLSNPITISAPSGFTVSPTTLPANATDSEVSVSFSGSSSTNGNITLTSGSASTTINVSGYLTMKPDANTAYHIIQNTSSYAIDKTDTNTPVLSIVEQTSSTQQFNFEAVAGSPNTYYIKNQSGEYLEATAANEIKYVTTTSDRSKWIIVGTREKYVRFRNFVSNTYLRTNTSTTLDLNDLGLADDANALFSLTTSFKIPPLTPRWCLGHIVWEDNGNTQASTTGLVNDYFAHNMPVNGVIVDSPWSTAYSSFDWNTGRYPTHEQMIADFNSKGVKTILWMTGNINSKSNPGDVPIQKDPGYDFALENNYVVNNGRESSWWKGTGLHLDFTNPDAVAWWNERLDKVFVDGVAGFKVDQGAIYFGQNVETSIGTITNAEFRPYYYNSIFDYVTSKKTEGMMVGRPFSHQGGFAASVEKLSLGWCGDFSGNFGGLKLQVSNIFTSAEEGYGAPGCEIGGFFEEKSTKNELIRYVQFGAMTASMINGGENGGLTNHLPWWHDAGSGNTETEDAYFQAVWLHEQLVPYIFSNIVKSHVSSGGSIIKNFNRAEESHTLGDLIFSKAITSRVNDVTYTLPNNGKWIDFWNRTTYAGGTVINETYDFSKFPLFFKVGAIIPMDITNSYSGIGSAALDTYQTMVIVPDVENVSTVDYFRPLGDGIEYDTSKISYDGPGSKISVDGSSSVKYAFLLLDVEEPLNVTNSDSYEYDAAKRELLIKKTGTSFDINIEFKALSLEENNTQDFINIFPNPANDIVNIHTKSFTDYSVKIYNVTGTLILNEKKKGHSVLNLSRLNTGVYFMRIEQDNKIITVKKLIKN
ncbi:TIM-barrel domain-containing protein [Thalassobellus citreus]|uniref:TIM-barrel domain-containing protein n=1 Tax=Thalassobellus citreus TaxID=3367752 RepID=UPI0037B08F26